jgi:hypothetical protein
MKHTKMAIYIIYSKDNAVVESLFTQIEQSTGVIPSHYDVNNINLNGHSSIENVVTAFELAASITLDMTQLSIDNKVAMRKLEGNNYVVVTTLSDEAINDDLSHNIKATRQTLLIDSDWTDTLSAQTRLGDVLYQAWQDYRQALRDITLQPDYPLEVIWPIAP